MITSLRNNKVRYVQELQKRRTSRQRANRYVFEGLRLVEEVAHANAAPEFVLYTHGAAGAERGSSLLATFHRMSVPCFAVTDAVMHACSDTETPQGILAVVPVPSVPPPRDPTLTLIADGVRDPGNLGTMLRTGLAAGIDQIVLLPGTVDPGNPKVIRSAMGAHLRLPIVNLEWGDIGDFISDARVWLASADGETSYTSVDWREPAALIIGGEAEGAGRPARMLAHGQVSIPMAEGVESLNTAIAAAVLLFEIRRQRRWPR